MIKLRLTKIGRSAGNWPCSCNFSGHDEVQSRIFSLRLVLTKDLLKADTRIIKVRGFATNARDTLEGAYKKSWTALVLVLTPE